MAKYIGNVGVAQQDAKHETVGLRDRDQKRVLAIQVICFFFCFFFESD